jgi:hypothetical protein
MTTTKIAYAIAAIVPFGFVILATVFLAHAAYVQHKGRQQQDVAA